MFRTNVASRAVLVVSEGGTDKLICWSRNVVHGQSKFVRATRECRNLRSFSGNSTRGLVLVCACGAMIIGAVCLLAGCGTGPAPDDGSQTEPAPGESGSVCLPDDTCAQGLECIDGVCQEAAAEQDDGQNDGQDGEAEALLVFHNGTGPMCLAALDWFEEVRSDYPEVVIEEHLTYEAGEVDLLAQYEVPFSASQGVSTSFEFLPIIFFQGQAFSGFDDEVAGALEQLLAAVAADGS